MATMYVFPLDLDPAYYRAIGEVAARGALLDKQLGDPIRVGFGVGKKEGRVLTNGMSIKVKANVINALSLRWIKAPQLRVEAKKISREAFKVMQKRNEIVHGVFGHPEDAPNDIRMIYTRSAEERIMPKAERKSPADIAGIAEEIRALQKRILKLVKAMEAG